MLIALLLLAVTALAVFVFVVYTGVLKTSGDQKKAEKNADAILDQAFDGRDDVTFKLHMRTLKYETVIGGAKKRGYKLTHEASNQYGPSVLMFEKA
jgi:hypothetical protein